MRITMDSFTRGKNYSPYSLQIGNQIVEAGASKIEEYLRNICLLHRAVAQPTLPNAL